MHSMHCELTFCVNVVATVLPAINEKHTGLYAAVTIESSFVILAGIIHVYVSFT